ncbi:hypothetical protein ZIOFF_032248 [Zingiber officinale]|uniref:Protein kinase domain-containing protein n=1 Tax=Zingiber officinale TaxID=94328 RepID=A0A8J5LBG6_ZINOF|nr:hypothetical protein ZIOFF_032248 [Zingiber officinale]
MWIWIEVSVGQHSSLENHSSGHPVPIVNLFGQESSEKRIQFGPRPREARCRIEDSGRSRPCSRFAADPPENEKPAPSDGGERNKSARKFTFRDLATTTHNFREANLIGEGGFGRIVAIKQLKQDGYQGSNEFLVEVLMLTVLRHPNLVNLIGYCAKGDERLLAPIDWNTRMKIALGAAKGLTYLHDVANPPIIYRDMKVANVLLDENFNPKLCGHYKKLGPEYEKLGSSFKKAKSVLIGKVDCDIRAYAASMECQDTQQFSGFLKDQSSLHMMHNKYEQSCRYEDVLVEFYAPWYGVSGYPTLKFFPKENKAGEDYEAERDLDALVKEFVSASNEEQKAILSRMEEEVAKLTGSSAS